MIIFTPQLVSGQPRNYVPIYLPPRGYYVDWMDVKAVYMKDDENWLYFYVEYYGAIPSSKYYSRDLLIFMDTDMNDQTGEFICTCDQTGEPWKDSLGADYLISSHLRGDNSTSWAVLSKWSNTAGRWQGEFKNLKSEATLAPGLSFMEIKVNKRDVGYTPNGIHFLILSASAVDMPNTNVSYVIDSSIKNIVVDGEPGDWGTATPLITFPPRLIEPPELEVSNVYVANDGNNLYFRFDTKGKPSTRVDAGELLFFIYIDVDNNVNTGVRAFWANSSKGTEVDYYRCTGTGSDRRCQRIGGSSNSADFNNTFEFKIPLSLLGLGSGQTVGIYIWGLGEFVRRIPQSGYLTYPSTTSPVTSMRKTRLTLNISPSRISGKVGTTITITGKLTIEEVGIGLGGKTINIYRNGSIIGSCVTTNGSYKFEWKDVRLEEGNYEITAKFNGDSTYAASDANTTLTVMPAPLMSIIIEFLQPLIPLILVIMAIVIILRRSLARTRPKKPSPPSAYVPPSRRKREEEIEVSRRWIESEIEKIKDFMEELES
jgi:hypothetical protein